MEELVADGDRWFENLTWACTLVLRKSSITQRVLTNIDLQRQAPPRQRKPERRRFVNQKLPTPRWAIVAPTLSGLMLSPLEIHTYIGGVVRRDLASCQNQTSVATKVRQKLTQCTFALGPSQLPEERSTITKRIGGG